MGNDMWIKRLMVLVVSGALMAALAATATLAQQEVQGPVTVTGVIQEKDSELPLAPDTGLYFINDEETGAERDLLDCNDTVSIENFVGQRVTVTGIPQTQGEPPTGKEPLCVTAIELAEVVTPDQAVVTPDQGVQVTTLPDTGGLTLLPIVGAMLVAGGLLGTRMLRRR